MNKIYISTLMIAVAATFAACDDDDDDNPTIVTNESTEFVLNTPYYASQNVDLASSDSLQLTWSQPTWGFPVACSYSIQLSATGSFTVSNTEASADESGATVADYYSLSTVTSCTAKVSAATVAGALTTLNGWAEEDVPETATVYVRVQATPSATASVDYLTATSNTVSFTVVPYYADLSDADIEIWYLIGADIGDGSWGSEIGVAVVPMSPVEGESYNSQTGQGVISYTGYFAGLGFKLVMVPGSWDQQWGGSIGNFVKNDNGDNIMLDPGYYTVTLNTATDELTITAVEAGSEPTEYGVMYISGDFNSWGTTTEMTAANTASGVEHNHIWYYDLDASDGATTAKFLPNSDWSPNWGASDFPSGFGVNNGDNIPVSQGNWRVIFNDIDGYYTFIEM